MTVALIYSGFEGLIIAQAGSRAELRGELVDLRAKHPERIYALADGTTQREALKRATEAYCSMLVHREKRKAALRRLPPVEGEAEMSHADWVAVSKELSPKFRGEIANLAAHGWAISRIELGVLVSGNRSSYAYTDQCRTVETAKVCANCIYQQHSYERPYTSTPLDCRVAYKKYGASVSRPVGRIQTCSDFST